MRSRHLPRNGTSRVFQIRLPKNLDPGFQLAPIRITLGSVPNARARRAADILAGLARIEFERFGAQPIPPDPAFTRQSVERRLALTVPTLLGLNALGDSLLSDDVREPATDAAFDALAQIGFDRAAGRGVFANEAIRFEAPLLAALREENPARALIGKPALTAKASDPIQSQLDAIQAQQAELLARLAPRCLRSELASRRGWCADRPRRRIGIVFSRKAWSKARLPDRPAASSIRWSAVARPAAPSPCGSARRAAARCPRRS